MTATTKTPAQIAATVPTPTERQFPVGKAQQQVLDALGLRAQGFNHANQIFEALGIQVTSVRTGRTSQARVAIMSRYAGAMNQYGEGEEWLAYPDVDLSALRPFLS